MAESDRRIAEIGAKIAELDARRTEPEPPPAPAPRRRSCARGAVSRQRTSGNGRRHVRTAAGPRRFTAGLIAHPRNRPSSTGSSARPSCRGHEYASC